MGMCVVENLSRVFLSEWPPITFVGNEGIYSMGKGKKVTLKNPLSRIFRGNLQRRPYLRDTCKNDSLT